MKYNAVLDLHTHSLASGHAYCTIREMAKGAADKGFKLLGITDHTPSMPGSCHNFYFHNFKVIPRELYGVRLLMGAELNILNPEGEVDLSETELKRLDVVIASLHIPCFSPKTCYENTQAYLNVMKNPYVNIIGHPDDGRYSVDYRAVVECAKKFNKVLELNSQSLNPAGFRQDSREKDLEILELCKEYQVPVLMGSDAHFDTLIGDFDRARSVLEEVDFPEELVLNRSIEAVAKYVNKGLEDF